MEQDIHAVIIYLAFYFFPPFYDLELTIVFIRWMCAAEQNCVTLFENESHIKDTFGKILNQLTRHY